MRKAAGILAALLLLALSADLLTLSADAADIKDLIKKLSDKDPDARRQAASALADAGAEAKPAVAILAKSLKDKDVFVRRFSAQALGNIGSDASAAIPSLRAVLLDPKESKEVQEGAATALGKMGKGGVDTLITTLRDSNKDPVVRIKAAESLGQLGPDAQKAVNALVDALKGGVGGGKKAAGPNEADIRADICVALGQIASAKDDAAIKALESITGDKKNNKNKTLKSAASDALKQIKARK